MTRPILCPPPPSRYGCPSLMPTFDRSTHLRRTCPRLESVILDVSGRTLVKNAVRRHAKGLHYGICRPEEGALPGRLARAVEKLFYPPSPVKQCHASCAPSHAQPLATKVNVSNP